MNMYYSKNNQKACLVFVTHVLSQDILKYMSYLKNCTKGIMDMLILYDNAHNHIKLEDYPGYAFYCFNSNTLDGFFHMGDRRLPNTLVALLECHKFHEYEKYLVIENDIVLNGDFRLFASRIIQEGQNTDYMHIASDPLGGPQAHWPIRLIRDNPYSELRFAWCQMFFASSRFLNALQKSVGQNNSIHFEFLMPTLAYQKAFTIKQFENFGYRFDVSWGPAEEFEIRYKYGRQANTFYHPIKNLSFIPFLS